MHLWHAETINCDPGMGCLRAYFPMRDVCHLSVMRKSVFANLSIRLECSRYGQCALQELLLSWAGRFAPFLFLARISIGSLTS